MNREMKRQYLLSTVLLALMTSCSGYLDIVPDDVATIEYAFRDKVKAERFLATCYSYIPDIGNPAKDPAIMGSDETWNFINTTEANSSVGSYNSFYIKLGLQNTNSPYVNCWDGENSGEDLFEGIRNCNIFLENADNVGPQLAGAEKEQWKAEAKFLKAYYHYYLMRMYGPSPLIKENLSIEATTEEVKVYRDPLDECVDYVVQLIDEAEKRGDFSSRLALFEECKTLPFGAIWDEYCNRCGVPVGTAWIDVVKSYEKNVLAKRK